MNNKIGWIDLGRPFGGSVTISVFDIESIETDADSTWVGFRSGRTMAVTESREQVKEKIEQCLSK